MVSTLQTSEIKMIVTEWLLNVICMLLALDGLLQNFERLKKRSGRRLCKTSCLNTIEKKNESRKPDIKNEHCCSVVAEVIGINTI